jgi:hypothetical protein
VAFEEGTQPQWLHDLLIDHAARALGFKETDDASDIALGFRPPSLHPQISFAYSRMVRSPEK